MAEDVTYDLFISHAYEDKEEFANDLALELTKAGLKVWYSGYHLKLGDSIAESINAALKGAAFGIVVISPVYLEKRWAMNELNALFAQEGRNTRILPILHNITFDDMKQHFPILADRYTIASDAGMEFIVKKVLQAMSGKNFKSEAGKAKATSTDPKKEPSGDKKRSNRDSADKDVQSESNGVMWFMVLIIFAAGLIYFYSGDSDSPGSSPDKSFSLPSNSN